MSRSVTQSTGISWVAMTLLWACMVGYGMLQILNFQKTPAPISQAIVQWPKNSPFQPDPARPTLVMFIHPQCPCSKASLGELSRLMAQCQGRLSAYLFFLAPSKFSNKWSEGAYWTEAGRIPGVRPIKDAEGKMATAFKATASGECFLFMDGGEVFHGGLTIARGHSGDSPGSSAIRSLVLEGHAETDRTAVFGCLLSGPKRGISS